MIRIKNSKLVSDEFVAALRRLFTAEGLPVGVALRIMRIAKAVDAELALLRELAKGFPEESRLEREAELLSGETEISHSPVALEDLASLKLSAATLDLLEGVVDFGDEA